MQNVKRYLNQSSTRAATIPQTMAGWERKYTDEQRDAVASAYADRGIRPARRVVELAKAGELEHNGERLEPFAIPEETVRHLGRNLRKSRRGELASGLTDAEPRDAIESLRRRLVSMTDHELARIERQQKGNRQADPERIRQLARAVREIAAIPGPTDPRPVQPGAKVPGTQQSAGGKTRGGLAGQLLAAHRGGTPQHDTDETGPRSNTTHTTEGDTETTEETQGREAHSASDNGQNSTEAPSPGSRVLDQAAALALS